MKKNYNSIKVRIVYMDLKKDIITLSTGMDPAEEDIFDMQDDEYLYN